MNVDEVLIENQPSLRNPTMKTISSLLYSYFVMRGIIDKDTTKSKLNLIKFVSPSNKLKIDKDTTNTIIGDDEKKDDNSKKVYKLTKNLGVKYCTALINDEDKKTLDKYKKKDDMCDSFLQGFQYLFAPVPQKYMDLLKKVDVQNCKKEKKK